MMMGVGPIFLYNTLDSIAPGLPILVFWSFLIYIGVWTKERQTQILVYFIALIILFSILILTCVLSLYLMGFAIFIINQISIYFCFIRRSTQICLAHSHNVSDCWGTIELHCF